MGLQNSRYLIIYLCPLGLILNIDMQLTVQTRDKFGKANKALRESGLIPAELYGHGVPNLHLSVGGKDFAKVLKEAGETSVIELVVGGEKHPVMIHDLERDPVSGEIKHIDFHQVRMDEKIKAHIPIRFAGEAPAVKQGGILNQTMTEVEVEALPSSLPPHFTIDISVLAELNQSIYIKDLHGLKGVEILVDPETVIVSVTPPLKEEVEEQPVVDVSQVVVETEEKKAEREKEAGKETEAEVAKGK